MYFSWRIPVSCLEEGGSFNWRGCISVGGYPFHVWRRGCISVGGYPFHVEEGALEGLNGVLFSWRIPVSCGGGCV